MGDPAATDANFAAYLKVCAVATRDHEVTVLSWAGHTECHRRGYLALKPESYLQHDFNLIAVADAVWFVGPIGESIGMMAEWAAATVLWKPRRRVRLAVSQDGGAPALLLGPVEPPPPGGVGASLDGILAWAASAYEDRRRGLVWTPLMDVGKTP